MKKKSSGQLLGSILWPQTQTDSDWLKQHLTCFNQTLSVNQIIFSANWWWSFSSDGPDRSVEDFKFKTGTCFKNIQQFINV